jgi:iron complex transport system ATP-binding protein
VPQAKIEGVQVDLGIENVAILHDPNHAVAYADRILVLHRGRTYVEGAAAGVMNERLMSEVFDVTARVLRELGRDRPYIVMWPGSRPHANQSDNQPERTTPCSLP